METWLSPQIIEENGDRQLTHDLDLGSLPIRIGREPKALYPGNTAIKIGAIAPDWVRDRISRVQATVLTDDDDQYLIRDGNGHPSNFGIYYGGKQVHGELALYPGIRELYIVPELKGTNYKCFFRWLQSDLLEGDDDAMQTLGARNVFLEGQLEEKETQLQQLASDTMALQEKVRFLEHQRRVEIESEKKQNRRIAEMSAEQDKKIAELSAEQRRLRRMWLIISCVIIVAIILMTSVDIESLIHIVQGIVAILTVAGVVKTVQSGD